MAERKPFLLRLPPELMEELNRWARDELRSVNAQIEYVLREALRRRRRVTLEPAAQTPPERPAGAGEGEGGPV
ncbi:MAG TPA: Arc family DNA-binding protein [Phycisphaerae bacterium]|nr:Arc family DNA-binding protein [Phycisphaerae bacterium]HNU44944.1 Arc family DNA-binding protein [Phycisphaerae bacterium]